MSNLRIPVLFSPFASAKNPHTAEVQSRSVVEWTRRMGYSPADPGYRALELGQFGHLMGRGHSTARREDLALVTDFATWLFLWDDRCDHGGEHGWQARAEQIRLFNARAQPILSGIPPTEEDGPLLQGLWDILMGLRTRMSGQALHRFLRDLRDYFDATVWQAESHRRGVTPDLVTYTRMRRLTSGVHPVLDLIEMTEGVELPLEARVSPTLTALAHAAVDIISWANDIFSVQKELLHGDDHNLVVVLHRTHGMTLAESMNEAASLHDRRVGRFLELARELRASGLGADPAVLRYVEGICRWIRANMDWSLSTGRYRPGAALELPGAAPASARPSERRAALLAATA